jgi:hypothetical protein
LEGVVLAESDWVVLAVAVVVDRTAQRTGEAPNRVCWVENLAGSSSVADADAEARDVGWHADRAEVLVGSAGDAVDFIDGGTRTAKRPVE